MGMDGYWGFFRSIGTAVVANQALVKKHSYLYI